MADDECQCHDARRWRAYWSAEGIAERLAEELDTARADYQRSITAACNDLRGERRVGEYRPRWMIESFAELESRRWGV